ncbi:haloacid dehalogenase [Chitinophagaceae bacterium IBVUCB2]|nr:haloacid dehalogenase [Chitinophagaceae bacterium IBVUCB2]
MKKYKTFLFDLNGTMINDMHYHINAWHKLLNGMGASISLEETKLQCYGKNHELLDRIFPGRFTEEEKQVISVEKEKAYQEGFKPHLKLLDGLDSFLENTYKDNIKMAIGSAAIMMNVDFVLDGLELRKYFSAIVSADDVNISKPDPETFLKCADRLNVLPAECLVFEDSPKGTESAKNAGMDCVAITTMHVPEEFDNSNIIRFAADFTGDLYEFITRS